jgi:penicillin-binding protein 2
MEYFKPKAKKGIESKGKVISKRAFILNIGKFSFFGLLISRLTYLQLFEGKKYKVLSDRNRFSEWKVVSERGLVLDRQNRILASNKEIYKVSINLDLIQSVDETFYQLTKILNLDLIKIQKYKKLITKHKRTKRFEPFVLDEILSWKKFAMINYNLDMMPGVFPFLSYERTYSKPLEFSHVIGYVGKVSKKDLSKIDPKFHNIPNLKVGKIGIEKKYEALMAGEPGNSVFETDAKGKFVKQVSFYKGLNGKNIITTLDSDIQVAAYEAIKNESGSVIVMDNFGEIITMVSSPSFDSNSFTYGISKTEYKSYLKNEKKPLSNKALSALYPPGSTIKMLVTLSALENNIINKNFKMTCKESTEYFGQKYHCWKENGHGVVDLKKAISQSCDIYFYEVARLLGVDRLNETARRFGLGENVFKGFIEERKGVVPSTKWKKKYVGQPWYLGETIITGIGQGYIQTTPIQLCKMMTQLSNGGYKVSPTIFKSDKPKIIDERIISDPDDLKIIMDALFSSTNEFGGTSYRSRIRGKHLFAGKTGTSQVRKITAEQRLRNLKNKDLPWKFRDHSLFVGYGPVQDPKFNITVVIDHGGSGSSKAAPIAKKIMSKIFNKYYGQKNV